MKFLNQAEAYLAPTGRIIMGAFFVLAGISKLMDMSSTAAYIESVGFPAGMLLALIAIIIEVGIGGALLIGYKPKMAALLLAAFTLFITFPFHGPQLWAADTSGLQQVVFMKNIVIVGSLLFMAAHAGKFATASQRTMPEHSTPTPTL